MERVYVEERHAFTKKATCANEDIGPTIGRLFTEMQAELGNLELLAPPCIYYTRWTETECDVQAAFVVDPGQHPGVNLTVIPECEAVYAVHVGPYEGLADAWMQLWAQVQQAPDVNPTNQAPWDCYLSFSDAGDPTQYETELFIPVQPQAQ